MIEIGDVIRTQKSGISGVVKEVVVNKTGSLRIRIQTPNLGERWTTYKPKECDKCCGTGTLVVCDGDTSYSGDEDCDKCQGTGKGE